ncbi:MAG: hypothetical protein ACR2HN_02725 [Tepidiformaceae bacterium]
MTSLRACCWLTASLSRDELAAIRAHIDPHSAAGILLTSCQRLEAYSTDGCGCEAPQELRGFDALLHLAEVAAGLHSVVLGEEQILGQVRGALAKAPRGVRELGEIALAAARELRRETRFSSHSGHLLDRGLKMADLEAGGASLLVIGAGHVGRLVALRGLELGFADVAIASRRQPEAAWFTGSALRHIALERLSSFGPVDVLAGCLGSDAGEIDVAALPAVRGAILDLGTPRNFGGASAVPIVTIAALLADGRRHGDERRAALTHRLAALLRRRLDMAAADSRSTVGALRLEVERVRRQELERMLRLHPEIPAETLETITRSLVNHLFHAPSERLKASADTAFRDRVLELFAQGRLLPNEA